MHLQDLLMKINGSQQQQNQLQQRIDHLTELIASNNQQLNRNTATASQLQTLLEHSFTCYDQLGFIYQPKDIKERNQHQEQVKKIMSTTKVLIKNVVSWVKAHSHLLDPHKHKQPLFQHELGSFEKSCKVCHKNVEEIVLREAKKEIIGPMHWKELFDQELLREEEEDDDYGQEDIAVKQTQEYLGSVSYLSKVIRDMETSVQGYQQVARKVEKEPTYSEDRTFRLLEDLIARIKTKMGERCLPKMNQIMQESLFKTTSAFFSKKSPSRFTLTQSFSMSFGTPKKRYQAVSKPVTSVNHEQVIKKLMDENQQLKVQKDTINELYLSANSFMSNMQALKTKRNLLDVNGGKSCREDKEMNRHSACQLDNTFKRSLDEHGRDSIVSNELKANSILSKVSNEIKREEIERTRKQGKESEKQIKSSQKMVGKVKTHVKNRKKNLLIKRYSSITGQKAQFRKSDMSCVVDPTIEEDQTELENSKDPQQEGMLETQPIDIQIDGEQEQPDVELRDTYPEDDLEQKQTKQIGCQWQPTDFGEEQPIRNQSQESKINIHVTFGTERFPSLAKETSIMESKMKGQFKDRKKRNSKSGDIPIKTKTDLVNNANKTVDKPNLPKTSLKKNHIFNKSSNNLSNGKGFRQRKDKTNNSITTNHNISCLESRDKTQQELDQVVNNQNRPHSEHEDHSNQSSLHNLHSVYSQNRVQNLTLIKVNGNLKGKYDNKYEFLRKSETSLDNMKQRHTLGCNPKGFPTEMSLSKKLEPIQEKKDSQLNTTRNLADEISNSRPIHPNLLKIYALDSRLSLDKQNLSRHNTSTIKKKAGKHDYFMTRVSTEGNEREFIKRAKMVRNLMFQVDHLAIFGGVSESYQYQSLPLQSQMQGFSEDEQVLTARLTTYISSLRGFKRSIYENIVVFLSAPFKTIEKIQTEFQPISHKVLAQLILKLLVFHKKKCGVIHCQHLQTFAKIIGFIGFSVSSSS